MSRSLLSALLLSSALFFVAVSPAQNQQPTAQAVISQIQAQFGSDWKGDTVDTFKAGSPDTPVTGIAVTMMATFDVLQRAAAQNCNLVITHEPTFYNHQDNTAELTQRADPVLLEKQQFIRDHHMVIWRFHDFWHARKPDGIQTGMVHALAWSAIQDPKEAHMFHHAPTTLEQLAGELKSKLGIKIVRVVGNPDSRVQTVALLPGAADSRRQMAALAQTNVDVLVVGETREWETVEYAADAVSEHKGKSLIILGHIPSEQAGMEECARWLQTFIRGVPIQFVPAREPFWPAGS